MDLRSAEALAHELMTEHGLISDGWVFRFDRATSRAGLTNYSKQTISLSRELTRIGTYDSVRDTILHEIAHALTMGDRHGARWRRKFLSLGGSGNVTYSLSDPEREEIARGAKYKSACELCGATFSASRKSKNMGLSYCVRTDRCRVTNRDSLKRQYLVWSDNEGRIVRGERAIMLGIGA